MLLVVFPSCSLVVCQRDDIDILGNNLLSILFLFCCTKMCTAVILFKEQYIVHRRDSPYSSQGVFE